MIINLPFPDKRLFPNRKNGKHWTTVSGVKGTQFNQSYLLTKAAGAFTPTKEFIPLSLMFVTPDKRHRDLDNMLAASKSILDGVAKALGIDDRRFKPILVDWVHGKPPGALIASVGVNLETTQNL
jgi:crossover junction endodeoxyribonuclease RusA